MIKSSGRAIVAVEPPNNGHIWDPAFLSFISCIYKSSLSLVGWGLSSLECPLSEVPLYNGYLYSVIPACWDDLAGISGMVPSTEHSVHMAIHQRGGLTVCVCVWRERDIWYMMAFSTKPMLNGFRPCRKALFVFKANFSIREDIGCVEGVPLYSELPLIWTPEMRPPL